MNERCSWCCRESGLGNSSRSSRPDLAGIKGGPEPRLVPRLGKTQKDQKKHISVSSVFTKGPSQRLAP